MAQEGQINEVPAAEINLGFVSGENGVHFVEESTGVLMYFPPGSTVVGDAVEASDYMNALTNGITAVAGGGQQVGTLLETKIGVVSTVATAADSITLPAITKTGQEHIIVNNGANSLDLFPFTGETINLGAANAAIAVPAGETVTVVSNTVANWQVTNQTPGITIFAVAGSATTDTAAVAVNNYYTTLTTTGAAVPTMADGTVVGQMKKVQMIVDVGDAVLTPANLVGGTTVTFADVGDTAEFIWTAAGWQAVALYNIVDGATAPVLA